MNKKKIAGAALAALAVIGNILVFLAPGLGLWERLGLCAAMDAVAVLCLVNVESLLRVPLEILRDRKMFLAIVKNDFQARFAGSMLGLFWAFVQPLITITLYWFVFQFGLRAGAVSDHPFVLFLMSGLVPWFYFSESLNGATNSLVEYSYLVKKVVFNVSFLPAIKVCSALFAHGVFLVVLIAITQVYGYGIAPHMLQIFYYVPCSMVLVLGLSYITAACTVFFRDMAQIVNIVLTVGIWATPIMWNPEVTMPQLQIIFKLNPVYYIVDGFRDALLDREWFWEKPVWTVYFWCFAIVVYLLGVKMFNRLKPHFSDVL